MTVRDVTDLAKRYTRIVPVDRRNPDGPCRVWFVVGRQSFAIGSEWDYRESAEWYATMFATALAKVVAR